MIGSHRPLPSTAVASTQPRASKPRSKAWLVSLVFLPLVLLCQPHALAQSQETLTVAVAANFRGAAEELGREFTLRTGHSIKLSSASTGILAAQMRRGAPFDLLLAADRKRPQSLVDNGAGTAPAQCYALGSLVLLGADSIDRDLNDASKSIAIANPRSAPYGAAAMTVLAREDFAAAKDRRVVRGSNVQQALQFYSSGAADLALIARSLSPDNGLAIPEDWHRPIEQYAVLNARSTRLRSAQQFLTYIISEEAAPILSRFGYQPCS